MELMATGIEDLIDNQVLQICASYVSLLESATISAFGFFKRV